MPISLLKTMIKVMLGDGLAFLSFGYLFFLAGAAIVRYLLPKKAQIPALLVLSWIFYGTWNPACLIYVIITTVTTYAAGRFVGGRENIRHRRPVLFLCLFLNIGLLFFTKYWSMFFPGFEDRLVPIGISFYTLQAAGYVIDCYRYGSSSGQQPSSVRGGAAPERNFIRYALFVSFFPGILSGPIERAGNMLPQYENPPRFQFDNLRNGMIIMLWGYFLKMVVADRIAIVVDNVYASPESYSGCIVLLAVFLYSLQIYCDFAGYSAIAVGSARVLGFRVMNNFDAPYLASSIPQFWRRWHISLSSWFRDYLYIPLGGSRRGTWRRYRNILIVFAVSGLWHGADVTFVIWGLLHGLYQIIGYILRPLKDRALRLLRINRDTASHRMLSTLWTFLLVSFAWIFFRADTLQQALKIIRCIGLDSLWNLWDGTLLTLGLDMLNWILLALSVGFLFLRDLCVCRGISLRRSLQRQGVWLRWLIYIGAVLLILVCGVWGPDYDAATFIYSMF